jgi:Chaperone of endosialidase
MIWRILVFMLLAHAAWAQQISGGAGGGGSSSLVVGTTVITGGATTQVLFNNGGVLGSDAGLTKVSGATGTVTFGGQLAAANGLVTAPGIIGSVDTNTGFYWPAAAEIGLAINGVKKFDYGITTASAFTFGNDVHVAGGLIPSGNVQLLTNAFLTWANGSAVTTSSSGTYLFENNGNTQNFTIKTSATAGEADFQGGLAATLASAAGTNAVCNTPGTTTAITVQAWATGCAVSDAAKKQNIKPIDPETAFNIVMAMKPVQYEYRPEENMGNDEHVGFTAQQIASIVTRIDGYDMITHDPDGHPHAVKYNEMAPLLAAAIQQLKADNDKLRSEIEALKATR